MKLTRICHWNAILSFRAKRQDGILVTYSCQICNHKRRDIAGGGLPEMTVESRLLLWSTGARRGPTSIATMAAQQSSVHWKSGSRVQVDGQTVRLC